MLLIKRIRVSSLNTTPLEGLKYRLPRIQDADFSEPISLLDLYFQLVDLTGHLFLFNNPDDQLEWQFSPLNGHMTVTSFFTDRANNFRFEGSNAHVYEDIP